MVSTDDTEIAVLAKEYGAHVPFMRSAGTLNDYATTVYVLFEVIEEYQKRNYMFDRICCIYPTAPFGQKKNCKMPCSSLEMMDVESVMPMVAFSFLPMREMYIRGGKLVYFKKRNIATEKSCIGSAGNGSTGY